MHSLLIYAPCCFAISLSLSLTYAHGFFCLHDPNIVHTLAFNVSFSLCINQLTRIIEFHGYFGLL